MLYDAVENPGDLTPDALQTAYFDVLAAVVAEFGVDTVVGETGIDRETVVAIDAGEEPELTLEEAAEILALEEDAPSAEDIAWEARDHLLMGMTTAVVDVDTIARETETELDGKEVQQAIEGRLPATLREYARMQVYIDARR